jgi:hypothetical protein
MNWADIYADKKPAYEALSGVVLKNFKKDNGWPNVFR